MTSPLRTGVALSTLALAVLSGCASPTSKVSLGAFGGKVADTEIGLATRAQAALQSGDHATAVRFAERAVEKTPNDAGFRTLLGNSYLAAGRFASAEAAYRDSLSLLPNQAGVALKLVLAQVAQGKSDRALSMIDELRGQIDAADAGLAMALAGQTGNAVAVLDEAARTPGADARVRQNLALAHALAGNWDAARAIAAQDLPADQVDARLTEWMNFAKPNSAGQQVASLIGVQPAASDPGQPVRLALVRENSRMAEVQPEPASPVTVEPAAPVEVAMADVPAPALEPAYVAPVVEATPLPVAVAAAEPAPAFVTPAPIRSSLPKPQQLRRTAAARFGGSSKAVVQLGAYGSPARVQAAWASASRRFANLKRYTPASARFDSPRGTFYRLSLKGFGSDREARLLCESLKRSGSACFVRNLAGDTPVRFASR
ncbi:SPOR domain-containing protein [Sphingomonas arenae]|uniref:SPOR domain-containing protein n=1 Tax=Sphingomonas arenae TaxID=2812555 RepID=UPI001966DB53|nr:SPOR domain-containing protein [Sphingomonas arenae]